MRRLDCRDENKIKNLIAFKQSSLFLVGSVIIFIEEAWLLWQHNSQ
jgi:hypothetical protein